MMEGYEIKKKYWVDDSCYFPSLMKKYFSNNLKVEFLYGMNYFVYYFYRTIERK